MLKKTEHQIVAEELTVEDHAEVEKHKYYLSEKAGHDVGWEFAVADYRSNVLQKRTDPAQQPATSPKAAASPRGLGRFFKRWMSKAASV